VKLDGGLAQNLAEYLHKFQRQSGVPTQMVVEDGRQLRFSPRAEVQLIRIIQEALSNVRKHARAKHAWVGFSWANGMARATVQDDGDGFDVAGVIGRTEGFGLQAMRERADSIGGQLRIEPRPGGGTVIEVQLPVEE
jgi:signal transduction histidine kinase